MQSLTNCTLAPEKASTPLDLHHWRGHVDNTFNILDHPESFGLLRVRYDTQMKEAKYSYGHSGSVPVSDLLSMSPVSLPDTFGLEVSTTKSTSGGDMSASQGGIASAYLNRSHPPLFIREHDSLTTPMDTRTTHSDFVLRVSREPGLSDVEVQGNVGKGVSLRGFGAIAHTGSEVEEGIYGGQIRYTTDTVNTNLRLSTDGPMLCFDISKSFTPSTSINTNNTSTTNYPDTLSSSSSSPSSSSSYTSITDTALSMVSSVSSVVPHKVDLGTEIAFKFDDREYMFTLAGMGLWPSTNAHGVANIQHPYIGSVSVNGIGTLTTAFSGPLYRSVHGDYASVAKYAADHHTGEVSSSAYSSMSGKSAHPGKTNNGTGGFLETTKQTIIKTLLDYLFKPSPVTHEDCVTTVTSTVSSQFQYNLASTESKSTLGLKTTVHNQTYDPAQDTWVSSSIHSLKTACALFFSKPTAALQYTYHKNNVQYSLGVMSQFPTNSRVSHTLPPLPGKMGRYHHTTSTCTTSSAPGNDKIWIAAKHATAGPYYTDPVTERMAISACNSPYGPGNHQGLVSTPKWNNPVHTYLTMSVWVGDWN